MLLTGRRRQSCWRAPQPPPTRRQRGRLVEDDENPELTRYIWDHFERLMTPFERRVGLAIIGRAKAAHAGSPDVAALLHRRWGEVGEPEVEAALADGPEVFRRRARDRVLSEHGAEAF